MIDLIVIAVAGAAVLVVLLASIVLLIRWRRDRYRFSIRALLLLFALIGAALSALVRYVAPIVAHRWAVQNIYDSGGAVWFEDKSQDTGVENPYTAQTLNLWRNVDSLDIKNDAQAAVVSRELARLPEAGAIEFGREVTDTGLALVLDSHNCGAIEVISFFNCSFTNNGLSKVAHVPKLRTIVFNTCPINSASLAELKKLSGLRSLRFVEEPPGRKTARLDNACFSQIRELTQLESLSFGAVSVSNSAARQLEDLKQLNELSFHQGFISDAGLAELRDNLPNTKIDVY